MVGVNHPDSSNSSSSYSGFQTTSTNALAQSKTETVNAVGDLVHVTDELGGYVDYRYDHQGNLASTTQGGPGVSSAVTTLTHDLLGRKTAMVDPDMGTWSYSYNAFGELYPTSTIVAGRRQLSWPVLVDGLVGLFLRW